MIRKSSKLFILGTLCMSLCLSACSSAVSEEAYYENYTADSVQVGAVEETAAYKTDSYDAAVPEAGAMSTENVSVKVADMNRKLIKTVNLSLSTKTFDESLNNLKNVINKYKGYVEYSNMENSSPNNPAYNERYASYTIRIPQESLEAAVAELETIATVTSKSENVQDVSLEYTDTESHIKALKTEEETLLTLLAQAENMDAVIALQTRLSEIRYEKESYESQIKLYDSQITYSTISLYLDEVKEYENVGKEPYMKRLSNSFLDSIENAKDFFGELLIILISAIPFLLPILIIIGVIVFIIIKLAGRSSNKNIAVNVNTSKQVKAEEKPLETVDNDSEK